MERDIPDVPGAAVLLGVSARPIDTLGLDQAMAALYASDASGADGPRVDPA